MSKGNYSVRVDKELMDQLDAGVVVVNSVVSEIWAVTRSGLMNHMVSAYLKKADKVGS